ncbi:MAG: methanol/ethanol family PQQ-dependent dehydrogenase, partial [Gammaproteobacteria bacterium]|nr:methanol/ethanol family PQQ-dependent dehydrogenase [Gammaproteobacteria bacterium]
MRKYLIASAVLASTAVSGLATANDEVMKLTQDPNNWAIWGGDYAGTRYSKLDQINAGNVGKLQVAWTFSTGVLRGHEGGPLVIGDTLYVHTPFPNNVFSINLADQTINWKYEPKQDPNVIPVMCCDTVYRGLAYADGKVFLQQADTTLVALDAKTGKPIWSIKNGDPSKGETNTQAPIVVKDKVLTGISGGEFGVRGWLAAYNIKDGSLAWKGYSMGPDSDTLIDPAKTTHLGKPVGKDSGTNTWKGDQWKIGGGTTWGWYTYDPELNLVYYGSGNPSTWNPVVRPGDNRWSMTIWARDVDTGMAKWVYQMTPHDEWDYDGINEMILADLEIGGKMRKTLVHFDRNGFGYTMDRVTGELLVAEKFDPAVNWATEVDMKTGRPQVVAKYSTDQAGEDVNTQNICPAALGSKDQQPAAYSPKTKLFYVPTNHVCMDYEPFRVEYVAGQPYVGATLSMYPAGKVTKDGTDNLGNFIAWDATTGKIVWSNPEPFSVWSGALATAGDVVFYGTLEGFVKAVDAKSGKELYKFKTPSGIIGNLNTWMHGGKQYIGVLSGVGGWAGI